MNLSQLRANELDLLKKQQESLKQRFLEINALEVWEILKTWSFKDVMDGCVNVPSTQFTRLAETKLLPGEKLCHKWQEIFVEVLSTTQAQKVVLLPCNVFQFSW